MNPGFGSRLEPSAPLENKINGQGDSVVSCKELTVAAQGSSESTHLDNASTELASPSGVLPSEEVETSESPQGNQSDVQSATHLQQKKRTNKLAKLALLGIGKEKTPQDVPLDDYDKKYLPDEFGQEMGPSARVWRVYLDEAELFDRDMVEGWKDGIDVLLVFAGLFSAVLTTFVVQTSQRLDNDYSQISASLLTELIAIQRAIASSNPLDQIPPSQLTLSSPPQYTKTDAWVNGLWFTSLALSLSTALFAVLIKQWIQHYTSFVSGSALERARIHQFRYSGLDRWHIRAIIGVLPLLLYTALFLFFLGLAIFLQALKPEIGYVVSVIGGTTFILYVVTNALPVFYPQCSYRTPLIEHIHATLSFGLFSFRRLLFLSPRLLSGILTRIDSHIENDTVLEHIKCWCDGLCTEPVFERTPLKAFESEAAASEPDKSIQDIIEWLLTVSSNPSVKPIALQSISGLPVQFSRIREMLGEGCLVRRELVDEFKRQQSISRGFSDDPSSLIESIQFYNAERIIRASIFAPTDIKAWQRNGDIFSDFPRPVIWKPLSWGTFDRTLPRLDQSIPFWQALTTYRILSIRDNTSDTLATNLRRLSSIATTSSAHCSYAAWEAWLNTLGRHVGNGSIAIDFSTVYDATRPLFRLLLEPQPESSSKLWADLLSSLRHLLPSSLVKESFGDSPDRFNLSSEALPAARINFCVLLLSCVMREWDTSTGFVQSTLLEQIVRVSYDGFYKAIESYRSNNTTFVPILAGVLDKLLSHKGFAQSCWEAQTYKSLYDAYFEMFIHKSAPLPTSDFSSHKHFHRALESADWIKRRFLHLFYSNDGDGELSLSRLASQIAGALRGQDANDLGTKVAFDVFMGMSFVKRYLTINICHSTYSSTWPPYMQPLIRWMLDSIINHGEAALLSHPSLRTFATSLIEREGFLAFICSSFLVHKRPQELSFRISFSEESSVLIRLAAYHKGNSDAISVWRRFLSWNKERSSATHRDTGQHEQWLRTDFDTYARMADFIDQLATTIGLDDPASELKVPRFEEEYIIKCLKENGRLLYTSSPDPNTQAAGLSSPNHQFFAAITSMGESKDATSKVNWWRRAFGANRRMTASIA